jgi:hypothetical protein
MGREWNYHSIGHYTGVPRVVNDPWLDRHCRLGLVLLSGYDAEQHPRSDQQRIRDNFRLLGAAGCLDDRAASGVRALEAKEGRLLVGSIKIHAATNATTPTSR